MNKTIYEYPIDTDEIIAECSSCGEKFAPTLKHVSTTVNSETSTTRYAACPKCGHRSEWFEKQTRSITDEENEELISWIKGEKYDYYPKAFRDAYCWKKYSPEEIEEIAKRAVRAKKIVLWSAVFLIVLFGYAIYAVIDWSILKP